MSYDPRSYQGNGNFDDEIGGYAGEEFRSRTHRPARHLENTQQAIIAARLTKQQAEARARQRNLRSNSQVSPDRLPRGRQQPVQQEDELYGDEDLYTRPPRSAIRHQPLANSPSGMKGANINYSSPPPPPNRHAIPPRRSQQPPAQQYQQELYTNGIDDEEERPRYRRRIKPYWLIFAGIVILLMIAGWMAFNVLGVWWQNHTDDVTFGMPRTFQIDAVVGHGDSNSNPSHFIALNLRGSIYVIEAPDGNFSKARGYFITTEVGGNPNPPVTIKFQDLTHTGRLDMVVTIGDPPNPLIVFLFNNGTTFLGKQQQ